MGFYLSVMSDLEGYEGPCRERDIIGKSYYILVVNTEMFGDDGVMIRYGQAIGVDLEPLTRFMYYGMPCFDESGEEIPCNDEEPTPDQWLPVDEALELATRFRDAVKTDPSSLRSVPFDCKEEIGQHEQFIGYFESGEVVRDLDSIIDTIDCYRSAGATAVRFVAG